MVNYTKGKTFKKGKKTVMYIYKGGKKTAKKLVAVNHKLARGDVYVKAAKLGYAYGRRRETHRNSGTRGSWVGKTWRKD